MKDSIGSWQLLGFSITALGGTLLHFLYDWLGKSLWIAPFSGVNESTWEHMKLIFWPMFIYALIQGFFFKDRKDFWCIKLRGILTALILIPVIFYIYNGVIGKSPDWINIAIFFISAAIAFVFELNQFKIASSFCKYPRVAFGSLLVIGMLFVIFTFATPHIALFIDPITKTYGI